MQKVLIIYLTEASTEVFAVSSHNGLVTWYCAPLLKIHMDCYLRQHVIKGTANLTPELLTSRFNYRIASRLLF